MSDSNSHHDALRLHDPEAIQRENKSLRERLAQLEQANVVQGNFVGEAPRYLINPPGVYLDDTHWPGGMTIEFIGEPNTSMVPLNEPAQRAMQEHIDRLTIGAQRVAERQGRQFVGLVTDRNVLLEQALDDARKMTPTIQMPQPTSDVPAMPHTDEARLRAARKGPGRRTVTAVDSPSLQGGHSDLGAPRLDPKPTEQAVLGRMVR